MNRVQVFGHGTAEVKIYPLRRKGTRYRSYQVSWYELGERRTKTLADPLEAKSHAHQVHVALLNQGRASDVTPQDIQMLRDAEAIASSLGVSLPFAIREWADARKLLGPAILGSAKSLADALHGVVDTPVPDVIERFIESKRKAAMSKRHFQTLCSLLRPFARRFQSAAISAITAGDVEGYIASVRGSPRTKNNVTATLKTLFTWAQRQGHLRADRPPVTDGLSKMRLASPTPEIFAPSEMAKLLAAARENEPAMLPFLAIGGFAGLRSAELARLEWSAVDLETGYIKIAWDIAKTRQRRLVPISANLKEWLLLHPKREGNVTPDNHRRGISRCAKRAGVLWKSNALRHSFGSFRLAEIQDTVRVSLEMGNSRNILLKHYRQLVSPEQAAEWFAVRPSAVV